AWMSVSQSWWPRRRSASATDVPIKPAPTTSTRRADVDSTAARSANGRQPLRMKFIVAFASVEVQILELAGHRAGFTVSDHAPVDLDDRRDLGAGAAEDHLVRQVELAAIHGAFHDVDVELLARERHERPTGDAFHDVRRYRWRDQRSLAEQEDVLRAAFADVAVLAQDDRLVEAVEVRFRLGQRAIPVDPG